MNTSIPTSAVSSKDKNIILRLGSRTIECGIEGSANPLNTYNVHHFAEPQTFSTNINTDHSIIPENTMKQYTKKTTIEKIRSFDITNFNYLFYPDILIYEDYDKFQSDLNIHLHRMLVKIFYKSGLPTINSKILLVVNTYFPGTYLETITNILINKLLVRAVVLLPSPLMTCIGSGSSNAIIIDIGWFYTTIVPIYDNNDIVTRTAFTNRASYRLHYDVLENLFDSGFSVSEISFRDIEIAISSLEHIDNMNSLSKNVLCGGFIVPRILFLNAIENLYLDKGNITECENDEKSIIQLTADLIQNQLPIDIRKDLASRIIITGGISKLKGFKQTIITEIKRVLEKNSYNIGIQGIDTVGTWAGASIYSGIMKNQKKNTALKEFRRS